MEELQGTCVCQGVSYRTKGEVKAFYLCHCSRCRKVTGSAHGANLFVKVEEHAWLKGEELLTHFQLDGTRFARTFCSRCSTALPNFRLEGLAVIPAGSLDVELEAKPQGHIFCASRANWDDGFAGVTSFAELPPL